MAPFPHCSGVVKGVKLVRVLIDNVQYIFKDVWYALLLRTLGCILSPSLMNSDVPPPALARPLTSVVEAPEPMPKVKTLNLKKIKHNIVKRYPQHLSASCLHNIYDSYCTLHIYLHLSTFLETSSMHS